jgi:hypothetical protein
VDNDVKDTREAPYGRAASAGDYGIINGGTTHTVSNLADVEEAGGLTHAAGVFTVPEAGVYLLVADFNAVPWGAPSDGLLVWFGINGTGSRAPYYAHGGGGIHNSMWSEHTEMVRLAANDTVRLCAQGIGGQTSMKTATMTVCKLRD